MDPRLVFTTPSAHLSDDHETIHVGMQRLLDDLIGHMRTVKVARIDMVHPGCHCLSQNSNRTVNNARWSPHLWAGKLHGAVPHAFNRHRGARKCEVAAKIP